MSRSGNALYRRLEHAGITLTPSSGENQLDTPWFVKALLALSGWLAAILIMGFIGLAMVSVIDSGSTSMVLGLVLLAGAYGLLRLPGNDFIEHLALATSLVGQLLVAWALIVALDVTEAGWWWSLALLQGCLALVMPNAVHRVFSTFAASLASFFAMIDIGMPHVINGLVLLALVWVWSNEFRWPGRLRSVQALGYGLVLGLLAMQFLGRLGFPLVGWSGSSQSGEPVWVGAWIGELLATLALLLLLWQLFQRAESAVPRKVRFAAYGGAALLLPASLFAYGVTQGAVVLALGFAIGNRLLMGLGVVSLLFSITSYYYLLDATLLIKALTLLLLGVLLLAIRWLMMSGVSPRETPSDA